MDRGVKIAIFAASIVSLALGLIWDQVLSQARNVVQSESIDELAAEIMQANVGAPDIARLEAPIGFPVQTPEARREVPEADASTDRQPAVPAAGGWEDYVLKRGDSANRLAYRVFKDRGLTTADLQAANQNSKWREGDTVRIPPAKTTQAGASGASNPPAGREPLLYEVQDDDSWWSIWTKHKDRCTTWQQIEAANSEIRVLRPGMKVKIP